MCIEANIRKAYKQWKSISKILKREGANSACMARFYITVVQAVLLYGAESWTITRRNMIKLQSFHNRAIRYMTGQHIRKSGEDWSYPVHDDLLVKCRLFSIETYIERRRGTLLEYLKKYRAGLLEGKKHVRKHYRNVRKILWWEQPCILRLKSEKFSNFRD